MTKTFKRIIITAVMLIALAACATALVLSGGCSSSAFDPLVGAKNGAVNTLLDASGIKDRIDAELRERAGTIAEEYGIPLTLVDNAVDSLAIPEWEAATLPADATAQGTYEVDIGGTAAQITVYDDPGVVTIDVYGQSITMAVPESAQTYMTYLQYLEYLQ